jgi:hypothetical protein
MQQSRIKGMTTIAMRRRENDWRSGGALSMRD